MQSISSKGGVSSQWREDKYPTQCLVKETLRLSAKNQMQHKSNAMMDWPPKRCN